MKLKYVVILSLLTCSLINDVVANSYFITYMGGIQTGIFKIAGDYPQPNYIDTVILDSSLLVTNFRASYNNFGNCVTPPLLAAELGFYINNQNGIEGKLGGGDTNWTSAVEFPDSINALSAIPESGYTLNKQFDANPLGINVVTITAGGYCQDEFYNYIQNYNSIVYFKYNKGINEIYGKLMIYEIDSAFNYYSTNITNFDFVYTISNSTNLNSGPVNLSPYKQKMLSPLFSNQLYDPLGRRFKNGPLPNQDIFAIPLFSH